MIQALTRQRLFYCRKASVSDWRCNVIEATEREVLGQGFVRMLNFWLWAQRRYILGA